MSAPSLLQDGSAPAAPVTTARLSASAATSSAASALAAITAAQLAATAEPPPEQLADFIDELSAIVHCPITVHQRELLTTALVGAIDARIAALFAG